MSSLTRIQDDFQAFILSGAEGVETHVVGTARVPIATRLAIYGDGYALRLIEALQSNYPALAKLLGEEDFAALGRAYVRRHDSSFTSIRYYGAALAEFLASDAEYAEIPVLAELARWEWAMTLAFDAADADTIAADALAAVGPTDWPALRFEWHPSVQRLDLFWNAPQIWKSLAADDVIDRPVPEVKAAASPWLLWRQDLQTWFRSMDVAEASALDTALGGGCFADICAVLATHFSEQEIPAKAAGYLGNWMASGLIIAFGS